MPEELAIAIIVLVVAVWILIKLFQALAELLKAPADAMHDAYKGLVDSINERIGRVFAWRKSKLCQRVRVFLPDELERAQQRIDAVVREFQRIQLTTSWVPRRPTWGKFEFAPYALPAKSDSWEEMNVEDIDSILCPEKRTWVDIESSILVQSCRYPAEPPRGTHDELIQARGVELRLESAAFENNGLTSGQISRFFQREQKAVADYNERRSGILTRCEDLNRAIAKWNDDNRQAWTRYAEENIRLEEEETSKFRLHRERYEFECEEQKTHFKSMAEGFRAGRRDHVINRAEHILRSLTFPGSIPRFWELDFDEEQRILVVEVFLPDVVHYPPIKTVQLKSGAVPKPLNQTEKREFIPKVHPAILLRLAFELFRNDDSQTISLLVLNGWVNFDDPSTGLNKKAYTASLMLERTQVESLNLTRLDPVAAFQALNGKSAGKLIEVIPIEPSLSLNKKDSRFVDAKAVLSMLGSATNLAAMDWQDFEHLIRELFEKEFAGRGAEVKITQASRDRGVDAIAFDPDPIHGGKYVIQAKRYTNTVDVSAVRDLCAVVRKEGASRGILVTTSTYGADAYAFANNEPVTLLNGAELLGRLRKYGYNFRINLEEARKLNLSNQHKQKAPQAD